VALGAEGEGLGPPESRETEGQHPPIPFTLMAPPVTAKAKRADEAGAVSDEQTE
jgi:hypothetical protein